MLAGTSSARCNALNLSLIRSGELVRGIAMGLGFSRRSRIGACGLYAASVLADERLHRGKAQATPHAKKARAEDGLEYAPRVHPVRMTDTFSSCTSSRSLSNVHRLSARILAPRSCCNAR